jgi:large subunit ribosomal protein L1
VLTDGPFAKFDETVALQLLVTLDPRKPGQNLRGNLALPHGSGKALKCLVLTASETQLGAGIRAGGVDPGKAFEDIMQDLKRGEMEVLQGVDRIITTPQDMRFFGQVGKVLGPRGLMPNPKSGTCADDIGKAVSDAMKGSVLVRVAKDGIINVSTEPNGHRRITEGSGKDGLRCFVALLTLCLFIISFSAALTKTLSGEPSATALGASFVLSNLHLV